VSSIDFRNEWLIKLYPNQPKMLILLHQ